jgi:hypothetical protein
MAGHRCPKLLLATLVAAVLAAALMALPADAPAAKPRAHLDGSRAVATKAAPRVVKRMIRAGNKIRHKKYKWGGGHRSWQDKGYDCSGAFGPAIPPGSEPAGACRTHRAAHGVGVGSAPWNPWRPSMRREGKRSSTSTS